MVARAGPAPAARRKLPTRRTPNLPASRWYRTAPEARSRTTSPRTKVSSAFCALISKLRRRSTTIALPFHAPISVTSWIL
jgi:hypothetical protein